MKLPQGFKYAGVKAGLKPNRRDLALIVSEVPASTAGVFTVNKLCAAPVAYALGRMPSGSVRAIVANSGNANAMTGPVGAEDERAMAAAAAGVLGISAVDVLTASTGSIGPRLPVAKIQAAAPQLAGALAATPEGVSCRRRGDSHHRSDDEDGDPRDRPRAANRWSWRPSPRGRE